jgi:hypothetical protein
MAGQKREARLRARRPGMTKQIETNIQQKGGTGFPCPAFVLILARD